MNKKSILLTLALSAVAATLTYAQPEGGAPPPPPPGGGGSEGGQRPGPGGPDGARRPVHPLLAALDTDKDGELSAAEITNATASLKTLDQDKDGKLSRGELRPQFGPRDGQGRGGREGGGPGRRGEGRPPRGQGDGAAPPPAPGREGAFMPRGAEGQAEFAGGRDLRAGRNFAGRFGMGLRFHAAGRPVHPQLNGPERHPASAALRERFLRNHPAFAWRAGSRFGVEARGERPDFRHGARFEEHAGGRSAPAGAPLPPPPAPEATPAPAPAEAPAPAAAE